MRKKMTMAAVAAMMAVSAYVGANSLTPSEQLSGIMLENVEALANDEASSDCKWQRLVDEKNCVWHACLKTGNGDGCMCGEVDLH